jgi:hypothetical protein
MLNSGHSSRQSECQLWARSLRRVKSAAGKQVKIDILGDRTMADAAGAQELLAGPGVADVHAQHADGREQIVIDLVHDAVDAVIALILVKYLMQVSGD